MALSAESRSAAGQLQPFLARLPQNPAMLLFKRKRSNRVKLEQTCSDTLTYAFGEPF